MGRTILIALLALGAVGGFAAGFMRMRHGYGGWADREAFERHVAQICAEAALKAKAAEKPGG